MTRDRPFKLQARVRTPGLCGVSLCDHESHDLFVTANLWVRGESEILMEHRIFLSDAGVERIWVEKRMTRSRLQGAGVLGCKNISRE